MSDYIKAYFWGLAAAIGIIATVVVICAALVLILDPVLP